MKKEENGMKIIDEDIKAGTIGQLYLLCGEERYLVRQYKEKFIKTLFPEEDTINLTYYEGKDINEKEIIDLAETLPFFAEHRLLVIEDSGFFKNANDVLSEYVKEIAPQTILLFAEREIDKRGKMFKAVKANGKVAEFAPLSEEMLMRWVMQRIRKDEKNISRRAMGLFLSKTGASMENIDMELEKLLCYTLDREEIHEADVEAVCINQTTNQIFDMVEAIAVKNQKKALELYYDLLSLKEAPLRILFLIARQFNILFQLKSMERKRIDTKTMASKIGLPEFVVRKNLGQAKNFSVDMLREVVEYSVELETDVKSGRVIDKIAVELLITYCVKPKEKETQ